MELQNVFAQKESLLSGKAKEWLALQIGIESDFTYVLLAGATSSTLIELRERETNKALAIVRLYTNQQWLHEESDVALHEANSLLQTQSCSIQTPKLLAVDVTGEHIGIPATVMTKCKGSVILKPAEMHHWVDQLAFALAQIHQIGPSSFGWMYKPYFSHSDLVVPHWTNKQDTWKRAIEMVSCEVPSFRKSWIHRDFHPCNVLFEGNQVHAVVDWSNACLGPREVDLAHCRLNLALLYGKEIADLFLQSYQDQSNLSSYSSYWDLHAIFNFFPDSIEVYPGWLAFGVKELTIDLLQNRLEEYLAHLLNL